jgi:hypothetical protein
VSAPVITPGLNGGLGILHELHQVMHEAKGVEKNGLLPLGSNKAPIMLVDDIIKEYRPRLDAHGILTVPQLLREEVYRDEAEETWSAGSETIPSRRIQNGKVRGIRVHVFVEVQTTFICVKDGSSVTVITPGEAMDTQDKSTRKAMTSAKKIAFIDLFQIITGEPEEDDDISPRQEKEDTPNRQEQKVSRAKQGAGVSAAPERETAPVASDAVDSEDRAKKALRDFVKEHQVPMAKLLEYGDELTGKPRTAWVKQITQVTKVIADPEKVKAFRGEGDA